MIELLEHQLLAVALASLRLGVCWHVMPLLARDTLPTLLRSGMVIAMSLIFAPALLPLVQQASVPMLCIAALGEGLIGLMLGIAVSALFWAVQTAAALIEVQGGSQIATLFDPSSGGEDGPLSVGLRSAFVAYFVSLGGIAWLLGVVTVSFQVWTPGQPLFEALPSGAHGVVDWGLGLLDSSAAAGISLAAPVVVSMLAVELGLGMVGRVAPQLQVFFAAMPLKALVSLGVLAIQMTSILADLVDRIPAPARFISGLQGAAGG
ncbi:MAG: EscT/YscT/HrcT family type III secretion system export apparatus protein [Janthinobacterium lividum]